jgi:hypothetical protein
MTHEAARKAAIHRRDALLVAAVAAGVAALAASPAAARVNEQGGAAIGGTDPVAYFHEGRPVAGRPDIACRWNGATWRFASAANRDVFAADPARYAPAFGGFCAYAVARGYTATIDPRAWRIVDSRLYLNYDLRTRSLWERDIPGEIARAETNWPRLQAER